MSDTVVYLRVPFDLRFSRSIAREGFTEDVQGLLRLDDAQIVRLSSLIDAYSGFLDRFALRELAAQAGIGEPPSKALASFLWEMDQALSESGNSAGEFVKEVAGQLRAQEESGLSAEEIDRFERNLASLVADQPGFRKQRKANRLSKAIGNPLSDVQVICDLRPIFSQDRTEVEGMLLVTTLKVVATGTDGLPVSFEARLTEKQTAELAEKAKTAKEKLAVLSRQLSEQGIATPKTEQSGS
jgi:hypothetical protein